VCCRHGAKTTRATCRAIDVVEGGDFSVSVGCTNVAKRGGLCRKHGAFLLETCRAGGCKRVARRGIYCDGHTTDNDTTNGGGETKDDARMGGGGGAVMGTTGCSSDVSSSTGVSVVSSLTVSTTAGAPPSHEKDNHGSNEVFCHEIGHVFHNNEASMSTMMDGSSEPQGGGEFNFLCDYLEDMYEQMPV